MARTTEICGACRCEALPGVTIVVTGPSLDGARTAISDGDGNYKLTELPAASYTVTFYYADWQIEQTGVGVGSFSPTTLDVRFDTSDP